MQLTLGGMTYTLYESNGTPKFARNRDAVFTFDSFDESKTW